MTKFLDGPAAGQVLALKRAPVYLRVVQGRKEWDALDQLGDTPAAHERIHVYRLKENRGTVHLNCGRRGASGFYEMADYAYSADQPTDAVARDTDAWRGWCRMKQAVERQAAIEAGQRIEGATHEPTADDGRQHRRAD